MIKDTVIFFIGHINDIGGVEQWIYYIAKKYSPNHRITLLYKEGKVPQLMRLNKKIRCIKYDEQKIECEKWIYCYDLSLTELVKAKEKILTIHADYLAQKIKIEIPPSTTAVYAVSENARKAFAITHKEELAKLGLTCETLYNPIMIDEPKPILRLISATRLTHEKGLKRMEYLAARLKERNIPFIWLVFTTFDGVSKTDGFIYMKPTLDILGYIKDADVLLQLSDTEGYAYTIVESLCVGTPVAVTDFPVVAEMGIENDVNGYIFKMDMSNTDEIIDKMLEKKLKGFKYIPKHSGEEWDKILGKKQKPTYKYKKSEIEDNVFITDAQMKEIHGRGFMSYDEAKYYSQSERFKKLSRGEQEEFLSWLQKL